MKFSMYAGFMERVREQGIEKAAQYAKNLGFSAVEFLADTSENGYVPFTSAREAEEAAEKLKKYELAVSCYSVFCDLWSSDPDIEQVMLEQVKIAAALGSPYFHHTLIPWLSVPKDAPDFETAIEKIVKIAKNIADYAADFGMICIYEDQGFYINGVEPFGLFWNRMKAVCSNVGICGDLGNILFADEQPQDFVQKYAQDICHIHVKDYLKKETVSSPGKGWMKTKGNNWLRDTVVGDGVVNFAECMKILQRIGYDGYYSLENTHPEPYEDGVRQAMRTLEKRQFDIGTLVNITDMETWTFQQRKCTDGEKNAERK